MSKKARLLNKEKRLQKKRSMKAANKTRYAELKRLGQNSKSKRFVRQSKKSRLLKTVNHPDGPCGNIACKKCFPLLHRIA